MSTLKCEIITAERVVFTDELNMVLAPGVEGQLGILPHHAPLMTALTVGELIVRKEGQEDQAMAIGGGFMEVLPDRVTILADSAERAEEIDVERAEAARRRAEEQLRHRRENQVDFARAEAALRRAVVRLKVAQRRRRRRESERASSVE